jgi:hypothetical protein
MIPTGPAIRWLFVISMLVLAWGSFQLITTSPDNGDGVVLYYTVNRNDETSLLINAIVTGYDQGLELAYEFAIVNDYVSMEDSGAGLVNSGFLVNPATPGRSYSFSYVVEFPVTGFGVRNYADLKAKSGASEAVFLFFRPQTTEARYHIDFSGLDMDVFNSEHGHGKVFSMNTSDLMDTYFIFGNFSNCTRLYGSNQVNVLFGMGVGRNETVCNTIFKIFDYYYNEFGIPLDLKSNFSIGFFSAKASQSMPSGFFGNDFNFSWFSHEMFHLWQPGPFG